MQTTALMQKYVGTVNRSIEHNRDAFPFKQMINMTRAATKDMDMQIAVYKDDPAQPHDYFTVQWTGAQLEMAGHGKDEDTSLSWKVPQRHLEHVVNNPEPFIDNPAKLDLDWLGRRMGLA